MLITGFNLSVINVRRRERIITRKIMITIILETHTKPTRQHLLSICLHSQCKSGMLGRRKTFESKSRSIIVVRCLWHHCVVYENDIWILISPPSLQLYDVLGYFEVWKIVPNYNIPNSVQFILKRFLFYMKSYIYCTSVRFNWIFLSRFTIA